MDQPTPADASTTIVTAKIPIVVGVVGHNDPDPDAVESLRKSVREFFRLIHARYGKSRIEVLSSLAEGSDQIVADVALEEGWSVRAPLPFPPDVYAQSTSFGSPEARDHFLELLKKPKVSWFVVPLPVPLEPKNQAEWARMRADENARDVCYANAGGYIARHCVILIALRDGGAGQPSGTEEMVRFKLEGKIPLHYPWRQPLSIRNDAGPVLSVHTPRLGRTYDHKKKSLPNGAIQVLLPPDGEEIKKKYWERPPGAWGWFLRRVSGTLGLQFGSTTSNEFWKSREMLRSIDELNRDVDNADQKSIESIKHATSRLLQRKKGHATPDQWLDLGKAREFEGVAQLRAATSELAQALDRRLKRYLWALFLGLFLALVSFHFYAHPFDAGPRTSHEPLWLLAFLVLLLSMAGLVSKVWYERVDDRRLDYRALAEALRVRYFWGLAGLTKSVADTYMGHLEGEMSWARRALYAVAPLPVEWKRIYDSRTPAEQEECLKAVADRWVTDQKEYYQRNHRRTHIMSSVLRPTGLALAVIGWSTSAWLLVAGWFLRGEPAPTHPTEVASGKAAEAAPSATGKPEDARPDARHPHHYVLIMSSLLVIGGGLIIAFCERRGYDALARQYGNMHTVFERGEHELNELLEARRWDEAREVIAALGNEALVEHVQWLILHRVHPFEMIIEG